MHNSSELMPSLLAKTGKIIASAIALVVLLLALTLYVGDSGIPFVEGTSQTEHGSAHGFDIGMTKSEAFAVLRSKYSIPDHYVEIIWRRGSDIDVPLQDFENTRDADRANRRFGIYRIAVAELSELTVPLEVSQKWELRLPAPWVHSIYLDFEGDSLYRITKDRWVFERP